MLVKILHNPTPPGTKTASKLSCKPPRATFKEFLKTSDTRHELGSALRRVGDHRRPGPRLVPMGAVLTAAVAGFAGKAGAVSTWEDTLRHRPMVRRLLRPTGHTGPISDDIFALAFDAASLTDLQAILRKQAKRELQRWSTGPHATSRLGKEFVAHGARQLAAWPVLAVDGHCLFTCKERKCEACIQIRTSHGDRWEHKVVVAQWVGTHPAIVVDFEPIMPNEGEVTAAKRLLTRIATELPEAIAPPQAVATLMMERWSQENTGFHERLRQMKLDRAYVHKGRVNAVWTVVAVALIAYNAWQAYLYKVLKRDPLRPERTWGNLQRDLWSSLGTCEESRAHPTTGPP